MRRLLKIILYLLAVLGLIAGGAYVYLFFLGGLERVVNSQLDNLITDEMPLDVKIGKIEGSLLSGITLENLTVYYKDPLHHFRMLYLPSVEAVYSLSDVLTGDYVFDYVRLDSPQVVLMRDSFGKLLLPESLSSEPGQSAGLALLIRQLEINSADVTYVDNLDTTTFSDVFLWAAFETREGTFSAELNRFEFTSNVGRVHLESAEGKVTYSEGRLLFHNVTLVSGLTRIKLSGNVLLEDTLAGTVRLAADNLELPLVTSYLGKKLDGTIDINGEASFVGSSFEGTFDIAGTFVIFDFENLHVDLSYDDEKIKFNSLYGTILDGCSIDGEGAIDFSQSTDAYYMYTDIKNFNLEHLVEGTFSSDLSGYVELDGESFSTSTLELRLNVELRESSFDDYPLQEVSGEMIVTARDIAFPDSLRVSYFGNEFYATGTVDYSDSIDLFVAADLEQLDRYRGKLFIDEPGGRGHAEVTLSGLTADPDLAGYFVSDSAWIYDLYAESLFAALNIERFLTGREGTVSVAIERGSAWGIPYDSGRTELRLDSTLVFIDAAELTGGVAHLRAGGEYDYGAEPQGLVLDTFRLNLFGREFFNRGQLEIGIDSNGFDFQNAAIGNTEALLSVRGRADYDDSLDLLLSIEQVPTAPWLDLFDTSFALQGYLSCVAQVRGTIDRPQFDFLGEIDSLTYRGLVLGHLMVGVKFEDQQLTIDSLRLSSDSGQYYATGYVPADLSFSSEVEDRFLDGPMDIILTASDTEFDLVSLVLPSVEQMDGQFYGNVHITGTPLDPGLEGEAYLKDGRLKYFDLEHPLFTDSAGVTMKNNRIIIDEIELFTTENKKRDGRRRYVNVEGDLVVEALDSLYYDLYISIGREFPFAYELDDIRGKVEGDLQIEGMTPPQVSGDLTILSTRYMVNFAEEGAGSPVMMALTGDDTWDLNINIDILSNYWIRNDDIDAEFAGQMNLIREDGQYRFAGEMEILRGKGYLFDKTFRLEPGSRVVFEGNDTLNPTLDIVAFTRVGAVRRSALEQENVSPEQIELGIHITGTLEQPEINPVEGSDFSREDILPLIVTGAPGSDSLAATGQLEGRLLGIGYSQVSQIGARQLRQIGVETFELDPVYGETTDLLNAWLTVGFYTGPNLYVYGRSTLAGETRQEVGFEYRLNRAIQVEGRRDEEELYHLNLRFHWEF